MMKRSSRILTRAATIIFIMSVCAAAFATMPAGAPRTKKDRENAMYRYVSDLADRVGQAGGNAGKATGRNAARLYDAAEKGADALYKEMGDVCREAGGDVADFCRQSYQDVHKDLRTRGEGPQNLQRGSSSYAPWTRSREGGRGRR